MKQSMCPLYAVPFLPHLFFLINLCVCHLFLPPNPPPPTSIQLPLYIFFGGRGGVGSDCLQSPGVNGFERLQGAAVGIYFCRLQCERKVGTTSCAACHSFPHTPPPLLRPLPLISRLLPNKKRSRLHLLAQEFQHGVSRLMTFLILPLFPLKISPNTQEVSSGAPRRRLRGSQTVFFCLTELLLWTTSLTLLARRASDSLTRRFPGLTLFGLGGMAALRSDGAADGPVDIFLIG